MDGTCNNKAKKALKSSQILKQTLFHQDINSVLNGIWLGFF